VPGVRDPHWSEGPLALYCGDVVEVLREMPDRSVHTVVTSPPYWGLRDYGTATWDGGDPECDHLARSGGRGQNLDRLGERLGTGGGHKVSADDAPVTPFRDSCGKCGARRVDGQLGLEPTPEAYVERMVAVFREVRRVLRDDGTLWLNIGDSYAVNGGARSYGSTDGTVGRGDAPNRPRRAPQTLKPKDLVGIPWRLAFALQADGWVLRSDITWNKANPMPESVTDRPTKAHEMVFLFAKAKRIGPDPTPWDDISDSDARWLAGIIDAEGSVIVRREQPKGNDYGGHAAQVSVGNTSRALLDEIVRIVGQGNVLERGGQNAPMLYWQASNKVALGILRRVYPFLIVKQRQARCAIALEEGKRYPGGHARIAASEVERRERLWQAVKSLNHFGSPDLTGIPEPVFGRWTSQPYFYDAEAVREAAEYGYRPTRGGDIFDRVGDGRGGPVRTPGVVTHGGDPSAGRNLRSVWTIATEPYPGAHFATFPRRLVEPCVKAGTSERGVCPECGAPWRREVSVRQVSLQATNGHRSVDDADMPRTSKSVETTGWRPVCAHYPRTAEWPAMPTRETDEDEDAYERRAAPVRALRDELLSVWTPLSAVPAVVLDIFAGSGTTLLVAQSLGRRGVGIDLNPEYLRQAEVRLAKGLAKTRAELARGVQHVLWQQEARR
jgi:DNA modification methylase